MWQKLLVTLACALLAGRTPAEEIRVANVGLTLIEKADVPAREAGVLSELNVTEGDVVELGQRLAQIEDQAAQLEVSRARIAAEEAQQQAENDIKVRLAQKSLELAELDLRRAEESIAQYPKSVSASQLDRLRLTVERARLEIEQARRDLDSAGQKAKAAQNEVQIAVAALERRRVLSPLTGIVNEIRRSPGEWLTPGETLVRVIQMDRLRAEGFVAVDQLVEPLLGRDVRLQVQMPGGGLEEFAGRVTFVSSEANPVNGSVRISAEIENRNLRLRAGQSGTLVVSTAGKAPLQAP